MTSTLTNKQIKPKIKKRYLKFTIFFKIKNFIIKYKSRNLKNDIDFTNTILFSLRNEILRLKKLL